MKQYGSLREKISAEKKEREDRYHSFTCHWLKAWGEGVKAALEITPRVMRVEDRHGNVVEVVPEGPCGFAWLSVPGNTSFGRWLKKQGMARPDYPKGLSVWISDYNQSHDRKQAHAYAMSRYLVAHGIECSARSRLD